MKIIVTGGAGFIASHIVDAYIKLGHSVAILDNLSSGKKEFINSKAKFYKCDVRDRKKIADILKRERPEIINHHAAQISVRNSVEDPVNDTQINQLGILNLLEEGKNNGLKKIIFASSGGVVYGNAKKIPTPEDYDPKIPLSPYGISKLSSEYYLNFFFNTYNIHYTALRYANVYGPRQNPHGEAGVVAIFTQKLLKKEIPVINGTGKQTRDYVFVEDVVRSNINALNNRFLGGVNIGTGIETDVLGIFNGLEKIISSGIKPKHAAAKKGEQARSCLDIRKAQKVLNWKPKVNLQAGLLKTIKYFQK